LQSEEDAKTSIFITAISQIVSHDPEDRLEKSGIPMKPDRVIGLHMDSTYTRHLSSRDIELTSRPIKDRDLFYPFLVVEAKREADAPGFNAIAAQTAFPIRRFLKLQAELQKASQINHDPLVWFLAFRGDEWRVYAGTFGDDDTVVSSHALKSLHTKIINKKTLAYL
jgi:hypothetical protein